MTTSVRRITITRPDDWHLHLRDGDDMKSILPHTARTFARAIIMPNLQSPITSTDSAQAYRKRILEALPKELSFKPLMTLYLTNNTPIKEVRKAKESGIIKAFKLYPAGATTNSGAGVTELKNCYPLLEEMQKYHLPLLVHGEVTDPDVDMFDRENAFIDRVLIPLRKDMPELKIVFEHISTKEAADYVMTAKGPISATITPHHLMFNRNALFQGGLQPHFFCLPVLKTEKDRLALITVATSGNKRFFLGTDSAPHAKEMKERASGFGGCFSALCALEMYAEIFDQANALEKLEAFTSCNGPDFYQLPKNKEQITLVKESWNIPHEVVFGNSIVVPLGAGTPLSWKVKVN